jgi:hypothetical protein
MLHGVAHGDNHEPRLLVSTLTMAYRTMPRVWSPYGSHNCIIRCDMRKTPELYTQKQVDLAS